MGPAVVRTNFYAVEEGSLEPDFRERALHGRPRHLQQLLLSHTEALARHGVFGADTTAEVGRIVRAERYPHPGSTQRTKRMAVVVGEDPGRHVAGGAHLEDRPALGDLRHQLGVLDRPHA